jgi:glycosyltransferase involved in cell wall biosynthesis
MITVVILTYNEAVHIERAVANVRDWALDVFIVDSHSTDGTPEIATAAGASVFPHTFQDYAAQREWALRSLPYRGDWVLFLDADEMVSEPLRHELARVLPEAPGTVDGYYVNRRFYWGGRWIRRGGVYPTWILRLARHARAHCRARSVNEHLQVEGETRRLEHDLLHIDLKPLSDWIGKHNRYATLEAREMVEADRRDTSLAGGGRFLGTQPERKQWIRERIWEPLLPPLVRPFVYFAYAYFFRFGFLDGRAGFEYHVLQGFSYRFMIEAKYLALRRSGVEAINPPEPAKLPDSREVTGAAE